MMSKIAPCLWFDGQAEQAANFYVSLLPNSQSTRSTRRQPIIRAGRRATC